MTEVPAPGWYADPDNPQEQRYWNGAHWLAPVTPAEPDGEELEPAHAAALGEAARATKQYLWLQYILGALIPIWGVIAAVNIAVAQKHAAIRRHALGIGAVALIAAGIYVVILLSGASGRADSAVASDLENLLSNHGVFASNVRCAHQSGNVYQCSATVSGETTFATVTDDGHSIYELGIPAGG